jgi:hypothetical protein
MLNFIRNPLHYMLSWPRRHKIFASLGVIFLLMLGTMYGIAEWYIHSERSRPLELGASFIPDYAQSLGLDPRQTMDGLLGIGVRHFRLVSYWSDIEQNQGRYDFSQLDWQFQKAEAAHAKISLSLGLRQPRWPECHLPDWAASESANQWEPQLKDEMTAVINRYKNSPALESYQLENEYFLGGFGLCTNHDRGRLVSEYNLVKKLDPSHTVIISRSNNAIGFPTGQPQPDEFAVSVYKRVWSIPLGRYAEYPMPAWYYGLLAGSQKLFFNPGKDMVIHELQAEAWAPNGKSLTETSLAEQNKSLNARRLKDRFQYGRATGMRQIYLWGSEYWYYRLTVLHDPSLWNVAKQEYQAG